MLQAALAALAAALALAGWQYSRAEILARDLAAAEAMFGQCEALLTATLEGDAIDATIPDDLDGFTPRPEWLLPQ